MPTIRRTPARALRPACLPDNFTRALYRIAPYKGCAHGCRYCDGRAEKYYVEGDFEKDLEIRDGLPGLLAAELPRLRERGLVGFGSGVTDPYQPCEADEGITAACAEILASGGISSSLGPGLPALVMTKSSLVLRDLTIWRRVNERAGFLLLVSLTSLDEGLRRAMEPGASGFEDRLKTLKAFKEAGCMTGVLAMPFLPGLSDGEGSIRSLYEACAAASVDFLMPGGLTLRPGRQKELYLATLGSAYPAELEATRLLFADERASGMPDRAAMRDFGRRLAGIRREFGIPWLLPHRQASRLLPAHDSVRVLLRDMVELYDDRGIATGPLREGADRYDAWLSARRREFRRRRSLPAAWLEGSLPDAISSGELRKVLDNDRLFRFVESVVVERRYLDYGSLRLEA